MSPLSSGDVPENGVPFDDVTLGGLLGKGSFGSVFYGWWNDMTVAIKVQQSWCRAESDPTSTSSARV
jgi:hypothetical protein